MPLPTAEQLQTAYDSGIISQNTYNAGLAAIGGAQPGGASVNPNAGAPQASTPPPSSTPVQAPVQAPASRPDVSNVDAMSGEYINPPKPLGVPADNSADKAEQARIANNDVARQAGLPQTPAPPPQAPPAPSGASTPSTGKPVELSDKPAPPGQGSSADDAMTRAILYGRSAGPPTGLIKDETAKLQGHAERIGSALDNAVATQQNIAKGFQDQTDAFTKESLVARDQVKAELDAQKSHRDQIMAERKDRQRLIDQRLDSLERMQVNPNRWFENMSTGQQIGFALSTIFAAGASPQGRNMGTELINNAVQRDLDAQKQDMVNRKDALQLRMSSNDRQTSQEEAELQAERDSTLTAYTIVERSIASRMALQKDNVGVQQTGASTIANLQTAKEEKLMPIEDKIFHLKMAVASAGTGGYDAKRKEALKYADDFEKEANQNGKPISRAEAEERGIRRAFGVSVSDRPESDISKSAPGSNKGVAEGNALNNTAPPPSTAWNPLRGFQGTNAFRDTQMHDKWNTWLRAADVSKYGSRGSEERVKKLLVGDGDDKSTIVGKVNSARDIYGRAGGGAMPQVEGVSPDEAE
jgi:hypothetical protein